MSCYSYYYGYYDCNNGLSYGARIGIGIGVAAGVILLVALCSFWRRRQIRSQFAKYRPPALPYTAQQSENNPYANNPPPPPPGSWNPNGNSTFAGDPYGNNPPPPPQTYQPSLAGAYGSGIGVNRTGGTATPATNTGADHEHGYEWEQAREQERLEREQGGNGPAPPGYDVSSHPSDATGYAPPPGPPPTNKRNLSGSV